MRIQRTYYEVLGLDRTASPQDVKLRYHELARQFHPDRAQDKVLAERLFVQINLAYRTLMDRDKRAIYDASLFQMEGPSNPTASSAGPGARPANVAPATPPVQLDVVEAMSRANSAFMSGDRITAHKICMTVLKFDPINVDAHHLVGDIYVDQGRRQEALDAYKKAASVGQPTFTLQQKIARLEALVGQTNLAPSKSSQAAAQSRSSPAESPKKGNLLDRFIGRGR